jgi:hypothetical protein
MIMKSALKQALADCLARLEAGAGIEECLRGHEALAAELRPLLEAAQALRAHELAGYRPEAFQRGRTRMHAARVSQAERGGRRAWAGFFGRSLALTGVAAVVAVLAALGLTTGVFHFGASTTSAQVNGVVSRVDQNAIVMITNDGLVSIRIGENTVMFDASGNQITGESITPGRSARIEVEEDAGEYSAQRIDVDDDDEKGHGAEVEFSGHVQTVSGGVLTVQASFGTATVAVDASTEVKGALRPGAAVEVHGSVQDDGTYLAREIEVKDDSSGEGSDGGGGDDGGDDAGTPSGGSGDDSAGSGSGGDSAGSGSGDDSSGSGSGGDDDPSGDDEPDSSDD